MLRSLVLVMVVGCVDASDEPIVASAVIAIDIPVASPRALSQASPCLPTLADVDPDAPGEQLDCAFAFEWPDGGRVLAPCNGDGQPCWELVVDATRCFGAGERVLAIANPPGDLPADLVLRGQCVLR